MEKFVKVIFIDSKLSAKYTKFWDNYNYRVFYCLKNAVGTHDQLAMLCASASPDYSLRICKRKSLKKQHPLSAEIKLWRFKKLVLGGRMAILILLLVDRSSLSVVSW